MRDLNVKLLFLVAILAAGAILGLAHGLLGRSDEQAYVIVGEDLEPFRTNFNAASDHVRAVLLVGPT